MPRMMLLTFILSVVIASTSLSAEPDEVIDLWPGMAPGETTRDTGTALPERPNEYPPATRIEKITSPQLLRYNPVDFLKCGASLVILPGGGYRYVVVDKEGSEIAKRFAESGLTVFVLKYRTVDQRSDDDWKRPVQDAQRAVRLIRSHAAEWKLDPDRVGMMGFSAGGNAAAIASTNLKAIPGGSDEVDKLDCRPNFTMLIYPWQLVEPNSLELRDIVTVDAETPPTFLVHAHDDGVTSLSSVAFYAQLKAKNIPAELHIYQTGGHGYGIRPIHGTNIHTWADRAEDWLRMGSLLVHAK